MDLLDNVPESFNLVIWKYLDIPVFLIDGKTKEIVSGNNATFEFFGLKKNTQGVMWPNVLAKLNIPDEINVNKLEILDSKSDKQIIYWEKLEFTDKESGVDRRLVFQYIRPPTKNGEKNLYAISIDDQTREYQASRERTDFVSLASHQLRTPLTGVKWNVDILLKRHADKLDQDQLKLINNIKKSAKRMSDLVNMLLQVTRFETGKLQLESKKVEIRTLLTDVIEESTENAEMKDVTVVKSLHKRLPKIFVDDKLVKYVFINLISNAIKYSYENGVVTVFLSHVKDNLIIQVSDQGIGISPEEQKNLFKKFYRTSNAVKHSPDGSGLGLHLCRVIAKKMGGDLWCESTKQKGTTFWFTIPMSKQESKGGSVEQNPTPLQSISS